MGLNYAYQVVAPRASLDAALRATARAAVAEQGEALLATAGLLAAGQTRHLGDAWGRDVCLSLLFAEDAALLAYGGNPRYNRPGLVAIGCVYAHLWLGARDLVLSFTAATTGMSRLFDESASVRETLRRIGAAADASSVALDREDGHLQQVWPREVTLPYTAGYFSATDDPDAVDDYAEGVRAELAAL